MLNPASGKSLMRIKSPPWPGEYRGADSDQRLGETMANTTQAGAPGPDDVFEEPIPVMQQLLDNPFLLLFLGIALPTVLYTIWGVMEIVSLPIAK
jgi:hypothetical protein